LAEQVKNIEKTIGNVGTISTQAVVFARRNPATKEWSDAPVLYGLDGTGADTTMFRHSMKRMVRESFACGIILGVMGWAENEDATERVRVVSINFAHEKLDEERLLVARVDGKTLSGFEEHTVPGLLKPLLAKNAQ
jgi:hypothetical protein